VITLSTTLILKKIIIKEKEGEQIETRTRIQRLEKERRRLKRKKREQSIEKRERRKHRGKRRTSGMLLFIFCLFF